MFAPKQRKQLKKKWKMGEKLILFHAFFNGFAENDFKPETVK